MFRPIRTYSPRWEERIIRPTVIAGGAETTPPVRGHLTVITGGKP